MNGYIVSLETFRDWKVMAYMLEGYARRHAEAIADLDFLAMRA